MKRVVLTGMSGTGKSSVVQGARRPRLQGGRHGRRLVAAGATGDAHRDPVRKSPEELSRILDDLEHVEPLLQRFADHEVRTAPLHEVIEDVLRLVDA